VPEHIVKQAQLRLEQLENKQKNTNPVISKLENLSPDDMSPREALEMIYELKGDLDIQLVCD
jgi:DNA mismatch repair ATPase MutS